MTDREVFTEMCSRAGIHLYPGREPDGREYLGIRQAFFTPAGDLESLYIDGCSYDCDNCTAPEYLDYCPCGSDDWELTLPDGSPVSPKDLPMRQTAKVLELVISYGCVLAAIGTWVYYGSWASALMFAVPALLAWLAAYDLDRTGQQQLAVRHRPDYTFIARWEHDEYGRVLSTGAAGEKLDPKWDHLEEK